MDQKEDSHLYWLHKPSRANTSWTAVLGLLNLFLFGFVFFNSTNEGKPSYAFQSTTRVFGQLALLNDLTPEGDAVWNRLTSENGGFVLVRSTDINENDEKTGTEEWGVSMFHALHCLQMLRTALAKDSSNSTLTGHGHHEKRTGHANHKTTSHLGHCLAYLTDVVTCQGDSTLEPPVKIKRPSGKVLTAVNGLGYQHQCRDIGWMRRIVESADVQAPWKWWPGQKLEDVIDMQGD